MVTMKPLTRKRKVALWEDTKIRAGSKWRAEIAAAIDNAKIGILLVSRQFLASDFIAEHELPKLLDQAQNNGLTIIWVAVGHCLYDETEIVDYQAANKPDRPLNSLTESELDLELVDIARQIDRAFGDDHAQIPEASNLDQTGQGTINTTSEGTVADIERIRRVLLDGKWAWRSIEALSNKTALGEARVLELLRADADIEFSKGKSGKQIARLRPSLRPGS